MATLVYEMYMKKIETLKEEQKIKAEEVLRITIHVVPLRSIKVLEIKFNMFCFQMAAMISEPIGEDKGQAPTPIVFEGGENVEAKQVKMEVDESLANEGKEGPAEGKTEEDQSGIVQEDKEMEVEPDTKVSEETSDSSTHQED